MDLPTSQKELLENLELLIKQTFIVENEFKELKNILNGVIEFLPQALWVIDENKEIIVQNSKTKEFNFIPEDGEIELNNKYYLVQSSKIENKKIISATDITSQKRNERLIAMGQMAAHLAHEIRNPIASVNIYLSILRKKCPQNEILDEMKSSILRVERIIKSTLLFSKGINIKPKEFPIPTLFEEVDNIIKFYPHTKDIQIKYPNTTNKIYADFDLLLLVFQNLIINAIDAIEEDEKDEGIIEIKYKKDNYHTFIITDTGKEFENKNILFEPFKSTKTKGHGLGLALSKEIINKHNGRIDLCKEKKGFIIKLPNKQDFHNHS